MARFGQMYLQKGVWNGKRILTPEWMRACRSTRDSLVIEPVAACGAWTAEDTYEVRVCYYEARVLPGLLLTLYEWRTATGSGAKRFLGSNDSNQFLAPLIPRRFLLGCPKVDSELVLF